MKGLLVGILLLGSHSSFSSDNYIHCAFDLSKNHAFKELPPVVESENYGYDDGYFGIDHSVVYYDGIKFMFPDGYETENPFYTFEGATHFERSFKTMIITSKLPSNGDKIEISKAKCDDYNEDLVDGSGILDHLTVDCSTKNIKKVCKDFVIK